MPGSFGSAWTIAAVEGGGLVEAARGHRLLALLRLGGQVLGRRAHGGRRT